VIKGKSQVIKVVILSLLFNSLDFLSHFSAFSQKSFPWSTICILSLRCVKSFFCKILSTSFCIFSAIHTIIILSTQDQERALICLSSIVSSQILIRGL